MSYYNFAGFLLFAFSTSITPGPNNILLFSHGKNFGFRNAGKLMAGIFIGFFVLLTASGYGLASLILNNQIAALILKAAGSVWLIYLAFILRKPGINLEAGAPEEAIGFAKSLTMQFINPKAWLMAIAGIGSFLPHLGNLHLSIFVFSLSFCMVGLPCMFIWIFMGDMISRLLNAPKASRIIGNVLFLLLILSVLSLWIN
jgi:threonine/homoserine/homoserine lactone efflux protein